MKKLLVALTATAAALTLAAPTASATPVPRPAIACCGNCTGSACPS